MTTPASPPPAVQYSPPIRRRANPLGFAALGVVVLAYLVVLAVVVYAAVTVLSQANSPEERPYVVLGIILFFGYGMGAGSPVALVGMALGAGSLFLKGRSKVPGIVALAVGTPLGLGGLAFIGTALQIFRPNFAGY